MVPQEQMNRTNQDYRLINLTAQSEDENITPRLKNQDNKMKINKFLIELKIREQDLELE